MPGRLRTASRPSSTWIAEASYSVPSSTAVLERFSTGSAACSTAAATASARSASEGCGSGAESVVGAGVDS